MDRLKKKLNGRKNILKYNIKKKKKSFQEKRGACEINCREVVF